MRPRRVVRVVSLAVLLGGAAIWWGGAAGATQAPAPAAMPVRVGGAIKAPTKVRDASPVYPAVAQNARVQGVVILEITVGTNGHVENARILRSIPLLDQAALDAVRQWEFTPTLLNGVAVPVIMTATVNFNLMPEGAITSSEGSMPSTVLATATPMMSDEEARREPFLLAERRAGLLQVGMSVDALNRRIPAAQRKLVDLRENDHFTPAIEIRLEPGDAQPAVLARYRNHEGQWQIFMIEVQDSHFRTSDGLGVGSTLADIHAAVPTAKAAVGPVGGIPVLVLRDRGLVFRLDPASVTADRTVPETAAVTRVMVADFPPLPPRAPSPPAPPRP